MLAAGSSLASDIVVIFVFITLGANLPFDTFGDHALPALATLAVFVFLARRSRSSRRSCPTGEGSGRAARSP